MDLPPQSSLCSLLPNPVSTCPHSSHDCPHLDNSFFYARKRRGRAELSQCAEQILHQRMEGAGTVGRAAPQTCQSFLLTEAAMLIPASGDLTP